MLRFPVSRASPKLVHCIKEGSIRALAFRDVRPQPVVGVIDRGRLSTRLRFEDAHQAKLRRVLTETAHSEQSP